MALQLSQNIKLIRGLMGTTQEEFAAIIGVNINNLKTYESSAHLPKIHIRKRIAQLAGVSVGDLLNKDLSEADIMLPKKEDTTANQDSRALSPEQIISNLSIAVREQASANNITSSNYKSLIEMIKKPLARPGDKKK